MKRTTAVELLKTFGESDISMIPDIPGVLRRMFEDKGFNPLVALRLSKAKIFGKLVRQLVLRQEGANDGGLFDYAGLVMNKTAPAPMSPYKGSGEENAVIDRALANSGHRNSNGHIQGEGATSFFNPPNLSRILTESGRLNLDDIPIAIIGHGAAGILASHALRLIGFRRIHVYEKRDSLGIWSQRNVYGGTKNNPRNLLFLRNELEAAPGPGIDIRRFLENLITSSPSPSNIASVRPGNLGHTIETSDGHTHIFPIVINAIGLGKPKPLSDPNRMITTASQTEAGPRWQQQLGTNEVRGKRFIFVGLGNSTAEMIHQLHTFMDDGVDVDYRIVTHYPEDAVWNPRSYVEQDGKMFRVFRDLSRLNLVDFQGDLPISLQDYQRALYGKKILYGVKRWELKGKKLGVFNKNGKPITEVDYTNMYSLTGYQHTEESITRFGCKYDPVGKCPLYDYDGEFVSNPGESGGDRLFKGYFGFGSILESPHNQNAIVLPGMFHRIGDLLFGVIMRAAEYANRQDR